MPDREFRRDFIDWEVRIFQEAAHFNVIDHVIPHELQQGGGHRAVIEQRRIVLAHGGPEIGVAPVKNVDRSAKPAKEETVPCFLRFALEGLKQRGAGHRVELGDVEIIEDGRGQIDAL